MNPPILTDTNRIEWEAASRAFPGEATSGDLHLVTLFPGGALAAVVDGLGHGAEATLAAKAAVDVLGAHASEPVVPLVERCHAALKTTRGAAMTVVSFNFVSNTASALGIGNVEAMLLRADRAEVPARESVLLRGGIVGDQLPPLQSSDFPVHPGDLLLFVTDGIRGGMSEQAKVFETPAKVARRILEQGYRGNDDALVLAIRYRGNPGN